MARAKPVPFGPRIVSRLDSSLGRVPACDAGDPSSIPGGGKLNVCPLPDGQLTSTHYSQYKPVLRIRDPVPFWPLDPGSRSRFFPDTWSRIPDPNPIFLRTYWQFLVKKFYNSLKIGPNIFSSAVQNWNNLQFCEMCGYIKSYDNKFFFTPLLCCCFWIRDPGWVKIRIRDLG